jgi:uncharacterized CHY-type Zn-finger protein
MNFYGNTRLGLHGQLQKVTQNSRYESGFSCWKEIEISDSPGKSNHEKHAILCLVWLIAMTIVQLCRTGVCKICQADFIEAGLTSK